MDRAPRPLAPAVSPAGPAPQPTLLPHSLGLRNPEGKLLRPLGTPGHPWPPLPHPHRSLRPHPLCHAFPDLSFSSPRALRVRGLAFLESSVLAPCLALPGRAASGRNTQELSKWYSLSDWKLVRDYRDELSLFEVQIVEGPCPKSQRGSS